MSAQSQQAQGQAPGQLLDLAASIGQLLKHRQLLLTTAESCTGGELSYIVTSIAGSSDWFDRGFVTYSNQAKQEMLDVNPEIIDRFGAVSEQTATAMAEGALQASQANVAIAVTGIAGPGGGSADKPVGTVWLAWAMAAASDSDGVKEKAKAKEKAKSIASIVTKLFHFTGDRLSVRDQTVVEALHGLHDLLSRVE